MAVFRTSEKYQLDDRNFKNRKIQNTSTLLSSTFSLLRPFLSHSCFVGRLRCANLAEWHRSFIIGKLPVQSLVPSLSLRNLIPFTILFSSVYLSLNKNSTPPDWQNSTPPDWQKQDLSGLAKIVPLRIGKNNTPPDWQK